MTISSSSSPYISNGNAKLSDGSSCGTGGISVTYQPASQLTEFNGNGVPGTYGLQLQIHTVQPAPSQYQQTIPVNNNQITSFNVQYLLPPPVNYSSQSTGSIGVSINPALTTTTISQYQVYNSNGQVTGLWWYVTYVAPDGSTVSQTFGFNIKSQYMAVPQEFEMDVVGRDGGSPYANFISGSGTFTYYGVGLNFGTCSGQGWFTEEESNMLYSSTYNCSGNVCSQQFYANPWAVTLSASDYNPGLGQSVQLTASMNNQPIDENDYSGLSIQIIDQATGAVIASCTAGTSCATSVSESSPTTQYYLAEVVGGSGYILAQSSASAVSWDPPPGVTINSVDQTGPISGYYTVLLQNGNVVSTGFTPVTFATNIGQTYTVQVDNYGNCLFDHWSDTGSTDSQRTFTATGSQAFTAVYSCSSTSTISVNTVNSQNQPITGYYTTLWQNGNQLSSCFSPCSFTVNNGQTYGVEVANYGGESFSHWSDGVTTRMHTVSIPSGGENFQLTAVYSP